MQRSPSKTTSSPDLSLIQKDENVNFRKRKYEEETMSAHMDRITQDLMTLMTSWKMDMEVNMKQINNNINSVIKTELLNLSTRTSEMQSDINQLRMDYGKFQSTLDTLRTQHKELKINLADVNTSLNFQCEQHEDLKKRVGAIESYTTKAPNDLTSLQHEVCQLRRELGRQQQRERLLNIEIVGIPETKNESLSDMIINISKHVGVPLIQDDIVHINRVQPRQSVPGRPKVIVAKFKSRLQKDSIISGLRRTRGVTTKDILIPGEARRIYVNEHLTTQNKHLMKMAKDTAKIKQYQYVWTKNCQIYVRKNDVSPAITIRNEEDIKKMSLH